MPDAPGGDWLEIETRHLTALATVARTGSFAAAALELGYVPSAVSTQIAQLERIAGTQLVARSAGGRRSALTPAGEALLAHARQMEGLLTATRDALEEPALRTPTIALGVAWLFAGAADPLLAALARAGGAVALGEVVRDRTGPLLDRVAAGDLDAAVVELPIAAGPFAAAELRREECVVAAPPHAPDRLEDALAAFPLVAVPDCRATARLARGAATRHSAASPAHALALVRAGAGSAVVSAADAGDGLRTFPAPARTMGLAWHIERDGDPAIATLARLARTALHSLRRAAR